MNSANFVVELIEDKDGSRQYIVRSLQGQPIKVVTSAEDLAAFFGGFQFKNEV